MAKKKNKYSLRVVLNVNAAEQRRQLMKELESWFVRFLKSKGEARREAYERMIEINSRLQPGANLKIVE